MIKERLFEHQERRNNGKSRNQFTTDYAFPHKFYKTQLIFQQKIIAPSHT